MVSVRRRKLERALISSSYSRGGGVLINPLETNFFVRSWLEVKSSSCIVSAGRSGSSGPIPRPATLPGAVRRVDDPRPRSMKTLVVVLALSGGSCHRLSSGGSGMLAAAQLRGAAASTGGRPEWRVPGKGTAAPRLGPRTGSGPSMSLLAAASRALDVRLVAAGVGGTFAGSLHAVTGPDHLAALLPLCIGRRWWSASRTGAYWGLGHGIGAALVGALAFSIRGALNINLFSTYMEALVGLSIIIIGLNGIQEAREWDTTQQSQADEAMGSPRVDSPNMIHAHEDAKSVASTLATGVLHGCSGSGHLLGVMPALAMPSWACATAYLVAFGGGTMVAMSLFTALAGEASVQMGERMQQPDVPAKLALFSSAFALLMGTLWTLRALVQLGVPQRLFGAMLALPALRARV